MCFTVLSSCCFPAFNGFVVMANSGSAKSLSVSSPCMFCGLSEDCAQKYGQFFDHRKSKLRLHYFCMLFSSGLLQRGKSTREGILGFLPTDIRKEINRGKKLICAYCKLSGSTIGCSNKKCLKRFHFYCGLENDALYQYFGSYPSYCVQHRPRQSGHDLLGDSTSVLCPICLAPVDASNSVLHSLKAPCCRTSWFHRTCIQEQALHAGYFFKCPLCNNKDEFQTEMLTYGIYIPEQDASWELEENAFQDLLYRHNRCDFPKCRCPSGPSYNKVGSRWEVILCDLCGSQGCHVACGGISFHKVYYECNICKDMLAKLVESHMDGEGTSNSDGGGGTSTDTGGLENQLPRRLGRSRNDKYFHREVNATFVSRINQGLKELLVTDDNDDDVSLPSDEVTNESSVASSTVPEVVDDDDDDDVFIDVVNIASPKPALDLSNSSTVDVVGDVFYGGSDSSIQWFVPSPPVRDHLQKRRHHHHHHHKKKKKKDKKKKDKKKKDKKKDKKKRKHKDKRRKSDDIVWIERH